MGGVLQIKEGEANGNIPRERATARELVYSGKAKYIVIG